MQCSGIWQAKDPLKGHFPAACGPKLKFPDSRVSPAAWQRWQSCSGLPNLVDKVVLRVVSQLPFFVVVRCNQMRRSPTTSLQSLVIGMAWAAWQSYRGSGTENGRRGVVRVNHPTPDQIAVARFNSHLRNVIVWSFGVGGVVIDTGAGEYYHRINYHCQIPTANLAQLMFSLPRSPRRSVKKRRTDGRGRTPMHFGTDVSKVILGL